MWELTTSDVLNRWTQGEPPSSGDMVLTTLIDDVKNYFDHLFPNLNERITREETLHKLLKSTGARVVQRVWLESLSGNLSFQSSTGPFSESGSRSESMRQGIYLLPQEIEEIQNRRTNGNGRWGSIQTYDPSKTTNYWGNLL